MARTRRQKGYSGFGKECPKVKRIYRRLFRSKSRQAIREGRFDLMPRWRGTEGWITW